MKSYCQRVALDTLFTFVAILGLVAMFGVLGVLRDTLSLGWMVGSFGASITLLLACPESRLGRPYPTLVSNTACAVIGVACQSMFGGQPAVAAVVALTLGIFLMSLLRAHHPPAGATALLAVFGGPSIQALGWLYPLVPICVGNCFLLLLVQGRHRMTECQVRNAVTQDPPLPVQAISVLVPVDQAEAYDRSEQQPAYEREPVNI
jgi:CBS domain-containing membrane protein